MTSRTQLIAKLYHSKSNLLTPDAARDQIRTFLKGCEHSSHILNKLLVRFNEHHNRLQNGMHHTEPHLEAKRNSLFNEWIYDKSSVEKWLTANLEASSQAGT